MKTIAIISLLNFENTNYGNRLQAYALNLYLNNYSRKIIVESVVLGNIYLEKNKFNIKFILKRIHRIPQKIKSMIVKDSRFKNRLKKCNSFTKNNMILNSKSMLMNDLRASNYDAYIVGSDIVWGQYEGCIDEARFLDFETDKNFKRFSYAASFGRDWIPKSNVTKLKECLSKFQLISVREASSVNMLKDLSINNVVHTMDPTLLLSAKQWERLEKSIDCNEPKYIFVYLLGQRKNDRYCITELARALNLKIATVPYACGEYNSVDDHFGDIRVMDCSPEEWLYLIHHAEYVITDSFHGTVFSTIFKKKFIVLNRQFTENINNRMIDYLNTINQKDKMIEAENLMTLEQFKWDYDDIDNRLDEKIKFSKSYLDTLVKSVMQ